VSNSERVRITIGWKTQTLSFILVQSVIQKS